MIRHLSLVATLSLSLAAQTSPAPDAQTASISGQTLGKSGAPLARSTLVLQPIGRPLSAPRPTSPPTPDMMPKPVTTVSDAQGNFTFDGLEAGSYMLRAEHAGYIQTPYTPAAGTMGPAMIRVGVGQKLTAVNIRLTPQAVVSGRILDQDGEPPARAQVTLLRRTFLNSLQPRYLPAGSALIDDHGDFRLINVRPGKYYLSVSSLAFSAAGARRAGAAVDGEITTYYPGVREISQAQTVEIAAGEELSGQNFRILRAPVFNIRGRVQGAVTTSGPASRAMILLSDGSTGVAGRPGLVQADGSFELGPVAAGAYTLALRSSDGLSQLLAMRQVSVAQQDVEGVVLAAIPPFDVQGSIRVEGETATAAGAQPEGPRSGMPGFRVILMASDTLSSTPRVEVHPDNTFTASQLGAGRFVVIVAGSSPGMYMKSAALGGQDVLASGADFAGSGGARLEIVMSPNGGVISGVVKDKDGMPSAGRTITVIPDLPPHVNRPDLYKVGRSGPGGDFRIMGVAPGKYRVFAWDELESGAQFDPDFIRLHEREGQSVTVEEKATVQVNLSR